MQVLLLSEQLRALPGAADPAPAPGAGEPAMMAGAGEAVALGGKQACSTPLASARLP